MDSEGSNVIWPRLVLTGELGGRVLNLFPGKADIFLRDKARKAVLLQNLGAYRAVMIATQGMPEDEAPDRAPYLVLGGEERLYAHEIEKLGIPAECVFLASCGGAIPPRQGRRMSIAEAFLAAGAGAVVGSLWAVAEDAACEMAYEFTVQLKAGLNPEQALHQARMAIRARGFDHPFFWAPFIVIRPSP
jgi:CHAT domain-containing protein